MSRSSPAQDIPLTVQIEFNDTNDEEKELRLHSKEEIDVTPPATPTSSSSTATIQTNTEKTAEPKSILNAGDEVMTRNEVPLYPTWLYIVYYISLILYPIIVGYFTVQYVDEYQKYFNKAIRSFVAILFSCWFIGAIFHNLCGISSNYTRKIGHFLLFIPPLILEGFNAFKFDNIIFDILWAAFTAQWIIVLMSRPFRNLSNYICGDTQSKKALRWFNCCENIIDAFERKEDRPNHLLWVNTQFCIYYVFIFLLSFWWNQLDSGAQLVIPVIVNAFGDGLAEPVGVKFGKNCFGKDCRYKTYAWCTTYKYTRSIPGSLMVLLSGYVAVGLVYYDYTMWQFIIAMIIVPPIGCIVEAKAPHTMDNPFLALILGVISTSILYIPL